METLQTKAGAWHNIQKPTAATIQWIREHFHFHELVLNELIRPTIRPKVQRFDHYLYLVLHFPIFDDTLRKTFPREIDFIITKKEIITVAAEPIPPLTDFFKKCTLDKSCEDLFASQTTMHLLYYIIKELYEFSLRELDHIQKNIAKIEEEVFSGREREVVEEISFVSRDIIDFRRSLKPQEITLQSLVLHGSVLFGKGITPFLEGLIGEYQKLWNLLENHKETLEALYATNTTLLTIKQNDTMKTLTMMAFSTIPLTLIATILSMNVSGNPVLGTGYDFWIILGVITAALATTLYIFKRIRWL